MSGILVRPARAEDAPTIARFNVALAEESESLRLEARTVKAGVRAMFRALCQRVLEEADKNNCRLRLYVERENAKAIAAYRVLGFGRSGYDVMEHGVTEHGTTDHAATGHAATDHRMTVHRAAEREMTERGGSR